MSSIPTRLLIVFSLAASAVAVSACGEQKSTSTKDESKGDKKDSDKDNDKSKPKVSASAGAKANSTPAVSAAKPAATESAKPPAAPEPPAEPTTAPSTVASNAPKDRPDVMHPNIGTFEAPVTSPEQQTYSLATIKPIADDCASAHVILVTAPEKVGVDYPWHYSRQAMLANQQYKVVDGAPAFTGEVSFDVYQADASQENAFVLVANCADGLTCNHLAAMYKAIVKSANPTPVCGDLPATVGTLRKSVNLLAGGPLANLPQAGDTIAQCARIAACTIADKTSTSEDVGISCQKAPSKFKLDCASKYPCAEVLSCMK
ncbi:MAG: hypothetical protein U0271_47500 [Polyangiaceae bacterium]